MPLRASTWERDPPGLSPAGLAHRVTTSLSTGISSVVLLVSLASCGRLYTHNPRETVAYDYPSAETASGPIETGGTPRLWKDPYIQRVDLLPGRTIFADTGQVFDVYARVSGIGFYSGNDLFPIPFGDETFGETPDLAWKVSAPLEGTPHQDDGYRYTVRIPGTASQQYGLIQAPLQNAYVGLDDFLPGSVIVGVLGEVNTYWDYVAADPAGGELPGIALIDGLTPWGCRNDALAAFAGLGIAGRFTGDCPAPDGLAVGEALPGSATLFSAQRRAVWTAVAWSADCDWLDFRLSPSGPPPAGCQRIRVFDAQGPPGTTGPMEIPVRVWKQVSLAWETGSAPTAPVSLDDVMEAAEVDLATLTRIMGENLGGMSFQIVDTVEIAGDYGIDLPFKDGVGAAIQEECTSSPVALALASQNPVGQIPDGQSLLSQSLTDAIDLVYVQYVSLPRAFACRGDQTGLVFISWRDRWPTLVAHEIGHVLSLVAPLNPADPEAPTPPDAVGHTDNLPEFGPRNVMYSYPDDRVSEDRHHLSLGQVFRMNLSHRSWIHRRMSDVPYLPSIECQEKYNTDVPCPLLYQDHHYLETP